MPYAHYTMLDFTVDDTFINWVYHPTPTSDAFWHTYYQQHPEQVAVMDEARQVLLALAQAVGDLPASEQVARVQQRLEQALDVSETPILAIGQRGWWRYAAAAAVTLALGASWLLWQSPRQSPSTLPMAVTPSPDGPRQFTQNSERVTQTTTMPQTVRLSDGSTVRLAPNSTLRYPITFGPAQRAVQLTGAAFFTVARRADQPFLVHTDLLTTKVLGTSFWVRAFSKEPTTTVDVKTGRVAVAANHATTATPSILLTPNQKAVYVKASETLRRTITDQPIALPGAPPIESLAFDDVPLGQVMMSLERRYGINIVVDPSLARCTLTTTLGEGTLFDQLTIICKAMGASFRQQDAQLLVSGPACQPEP